MLKIVNTKPDFKNGHLYLQAVLGIQQALAVLVLIDFLCQ